MDVVDFEGLGFFELWAGQGQAWHVRPVISFLVLPGESSSHSSVSRQRVEAASSDAFSAQIQSTARYQ